MAKTKHYKNNQMTMNSTLFSLYTFRIFIFLFTCLASIKPAASEEISSYTSGNFGLPGVIDIPTGYKLPDGQIVITQQLHRSLARIGASFQFFPNLGFAFRYSGHGRDGGEAYGRINHDRSFDAHLTLWNEGRYLPNISLGLRDFIGTGWYSSEYLVGTKSIRNLTATVGLGFGRLAGRNTINNPLSKISSEFYSRGTKNYGRGGTFGSIDWFKGDASFFYGASYHLGDNIKLSMEYSPDLMIKESGYIRVSSPWNYSIDYKLNNLFNFSLQYLHGSEVSLTTSINVNPKSPPHGAGVELAPVPMRLRSKKEILLETDFDTIRKVLTVDKFRVLNISQKEKTIRVDLTNYRFRSVSQAVGRVSSTLQRFTSNKIERAEIVFHKNRLQVASYSVDLNKIGDEQFSATQFKSINPSIKPKPAKINSFFSNPDGRLSWGLGPYVTHRLFNPDLPLSAEMGAEFSVDFDLTKKLTVSSSIRKSIVTNLTDNKRRSNSDLPRVQTDWPLYDIAGQKGHIDNLSLSYQNRLGADFYVRSNIGLLEPFFAGLGVEAIYFPVDSHFAWGIDIHKVKQRDFDMRFQLKAYEAIVGHLSMYYNAGGSYELEINAGKYLAGDWGITSRVSRVFGNGWEVGGYATLTDVPFETFGEGSFDKGSMSQYP